MGLITTALPNLVQGVSQQPDTIRFDGQCSEQTNAISSVVDGLQKRPNTRFLTRLLQEAIDEKTFVHMINRSDEENYVVLITPNTETESTDSEGITTVTESQASKLRIFNMATGEECVINEESDGLLLTANALSFSNPSNALKALTVADSTFLLNSATVVKPKEHQVQVLTGETDADGNPLTETSFEIEKTPRIAREATITIDQGAYDKTYTVQAEVYTTDANYSNTIGNDPIPNLPLITFQLREFIVSTKTNRAWSRFGSGKIQSKESTLGHEIFNVQVASKGSHIKGALSVRFTGSDGIVREPKMKVVMETYLDYDSDNVQQQYFRASHVNISDGGHFNGSGVRRENVGQVGGRGSTGYRHIKSGAVAPIVSYEFFGGTSEATVDEGILEASEQSGDSTGGGANTNSNTDVIAQGLSNEMFPAQTALDQKFSPFFNPYVPNNGSNVFIEVKPELTNIDFHISTNDSLSGTGLSVAYKEVDSIANLPVYNKNGFKIKIRGDAETGADDYYVEFKTNSGAVYGDGSYVETVGFEQEKGVDSDTMPQELINTSLNKFKLRNMSFEDKLVGDDETNPLPSFVGQTISNIFFYKSRLGFLSNSNVVMSEAGFGIKDEETGKMRYNFGRTAVTQLLDSDPIDIEVAASKVTNLRSAIGFQEDLVLFSENNQFILKGDDILTPKTVTINPVTNFDFDDAVDPIAVGAFVLFPFQRTGFTGIKQLEKTGNNDTYSSTEITEHVPHYIPSGIKIMAGSTAENFIAVVTEGEPECMYCYRYFYSGNNKVMSSWFKFEFDGDIIGLSFTDSTLFMVQSRNDETLLLEMPISSGISDPSYDEDGEPFEHTTLLDYRTLGKVLQGEKTVKYLDDNGDYTITNLPYSPKENELEVYTLDGTRLNATNTTAGVVSLPLNVDEDTNVYVGIPYKMTYTFSEVLFKAAAGKGKTPTDFNKMQVRHGVVFFHDTQSFRVKVTPQYRKVYNNDYVPYNVGSSVIGALALSDGAFRFPVMSSAKDTTITIENDTALPSNFSAAEFESFVHGRSARYAQ